MARKRHSAEQIIEKLRIAEVETAKGMTIGQVSKRLGSPSRRTTRGGASTAGCEPIRPSD